MDLHSVMCVSDLARSLEWYEVFFGREADEIIGEEHLWQVGENAYLVLDARAVRSSRVGGSMITFGVAGGEFDAALARLARHGVTHEPVETCSNGVRHVEVLDPDGNSLSLAALPQGTAGTASQVGGTQVPNPVRNQKTGQSTKGPTNSSTTGASA